MFANKLNERDSRVEPSPASRRSWATGIIASVVLHVAIAAALVVGGMREGSSVVVRRLSTIAPFSAEVTLLSMPDPAPQALQHPAPAAPAHMPMPASPAPGSMAPQPAFVTASAGSTAGSTAVASPTPTSAAGTMSAGAPADLMAVGSDYRRRLLEHIAQRQKNPPPIPAGFPDRLAVAIPIDFGQPGRQIGALRP